MKLFCYICPLDGKTIPIPTHLPRSEFPFQFSRACHKWLLHIQCTAKSPASTHGYFKLMLESQFSGRGRLFHRWAHAEVLRPIQWEYSPGPLASYCTQLAIATFLRARCSPEFFHLLQGIYVVVVVDHNWTGELRREMETVTVFGKIFERQIFE